MAQFEQRSPHVTAVKIAGVYAVIGVLWILFSDRLVEGIATSSNQQTSLQTLKGWAFVIASAGVLYGMVVREHRRLLTTNEELETALQQVHILHRILRHNLRNICSIIGGTLERLDAGCNDRTSDPLEVLQRQNERLVNLSEKSRYLRTFLTEDSEKPTEYDLIQLVKTEVSKARERYPNATIEVTLPKIAHVHAHHLIDGAIEELIENAIEHNSAENPTVWLSAQSGKQWTTLTIEDNGLGIPTSEQSVHRRRYETPLEHSQGLGLWLVQLTVEESDGELAIEDTDTGGSRILVKLLSAEY